MKKYSGIYVIAKTKQEIIDVQLLLFRLGKMWNSRDTIPLYVNDNGMSIYVKYDDECFGSSGYDENAGITYSRRYRCDPRTYTIADKHIITQYIRSGYKYPEYSPRTIKK